MLLALIESFWPDFLTWEKNCFWEVFVAQVSRHYSPRYPLQISHYITYISRSIAKAELLLWNLPVPKAFSEDIFGKIHDNLSQILCHKECFWSSLCRDLMAGPMLQWDHNTVSVLLHWESCRHLVMWRAQLFGKVLSTPVNTGELCCLQFLGANQIQKVKDGRILSWNKSI